MGLFTHVDVVAYSPLRCRYGGVRFLSIIRLESEVGGHCQQFFPFYVE